MKISLALIEAMFALKQEKEQKRAKGLEDLARNTKQRRSNNRPPDIKPPDTTIY